MKMRMMFARSAAGWAMKIAAITAVLSCVQVGVLALSPFSPRCVEKAVANALDVVYEPYLALARRFIFNIMGEQQGNILLGFFVMLIGIFLYSLLVAVVVCMVPHILRRPGMRRQS